MGTLKTETSGSLYQTSPEPQTLSQILANVPVYNYSTTPINNNTPSIAMHNRNSARHHNYTIKLIKPMQSTPKQCTISGLIQERNTIISKVPCFIVNRIKQTRGNERK